MRVLITGATGFIGSWVTRRLLRDGAQVAILTRPSSSLWRLEPLSPSIVKIAGSLENAHLAADDIRNFGADTIFNFAWSCGNNSKQNDDLAQVYDNIPGSLELFRLVAESGAKVFINAGSCMEYGEFKVPVRESDPVLAKNLYGLAKHAVEDLYLGMGPQLGVRVASARLFWSYGPGDVESRFIPSLTRKLLNGERYPMTLGTQVWDYMYITDTVEALLGLAQTPSAVGIFNIGSGSPRPLRDVAEKIRELTGKRSEIGYGEIPFVPGQVMHLEADTTRIRAVTGWKPRVPIEEGLRRTVVWHSQSKRVLPTE